MGTFRLNLDIGDAQGRRFERVSVLVDTGATYTVAPRSLLEGLSVPPHTRDTFVLFDGQRVELEMGYALARVDDRSVITLVVFGDEGMEAVLGGYTLEGLRLAADPVAGRLVPVPGLLMLSRYDGPSRH